MKRLFVVLLVLLGVASCKKPGNSHAAFYHWKTSFNLNAPQRHLLSSAAGNRLYLHFFDIVKDSHTGQIHPDGVLDFQTSTTGLRITPVIFIRNAVFEQLSPTGVDSLVANAQLLLNRLCIKHQIGYPAIQIDCDWTLSTRDAYFQFLSSFKKQNKHLLEVTIRLHQVKYKEKTGVPPADKGILMYYNMGKINADEESASSIYNYKDAAKYIDYLPNYPLPLDVALPVFSWLVHIQNGKVIGLPVHIGREAFNDASRFEIQGGAFRAKKSFFLSGIYIRENDIFKPEQTDAQSLEQAAGQLAKKLPALANRQIIYYELANLDPEQITAQEIRKVTGYF